MIPQDKANHFAYGAFAAAVVASVLLVGGQHIEAMAVPVAYVAGIALACALLPGILKEIADHADPEHHTASWGDVGYTVLGGLHVAVPLFLLGFLWPTT